MDTRPDDVEHPLMIIACDIGGVIKDQVSGHPIPGAIDGLKSLIALGHQVVLISKCKANFMSISDAWIEQHLKAANIDVNVYYCTDYAQKAEIASKHGVGAIIDDKMQVLQAFPSSTKKLWFCSKKENIDGAKKHQPEFFSSVDVVKSWSEVVAYFKIK